jgi:hypothetical protein
LLQIVSHEKKQTPLLLTRVCLDTDMKKATHQLPVELKHILGTIGVTDGDEIAVEQRLKDRAAAQVKDYIEIMYHKISQFHGAEVGSDVHDTINILHKSARPRLS